MSEIPQQTFSGIKVLAVARVIAAPFAARHLAVNGADVITIETPDDGDSSRVSEVRDEFLKRRMGRGFLTLNVNRRSLTLALNTLEGQDIFRKLARDADVVIENLRTGTMARYGVGYADLRKINPGIIFCSITGFGQTGPKAKDPGIDDAIQAASGMMSFTGTPESGPLKTGSTVVDYSTGYAAAFAIAGALFHRARTGEGQAIGHARRAAAAHRERLGSGALRQQHLPLPGRGHHDRRALAEPAGPPVEVDRPRGHTARPALRHRRRCAQKHEGARSGSPEDAPHPHRARVAGALQPRRCAGDAGDAAHGGDRRSADRGARIHPALRCRCG